MLEDREHALARGATIYGEILGYASTCDAWHRVALSVDLDEPVRAIELALADAGDRGPTRSNTSTSTAPGPS